MKIRIASVLPVVFAGLVIFGCSPGSRYERRLKHELAGGERYDTLFMGIYLGMSDKDFYAHCWMLNREGLIKQSPGNLSVERELKDELPFPATMHFYPEFAHGKIINMPVKFIYNGWAPWNKKLSAESLQKDVLKWFRKIYGSNFIKVAHNSRGLAYIWMDGNRRISIYREDDMHVWAVFTDMSAIENLSDPNSDAGVLPEEITKALKN